METLVIQGGRPLHGTVSIAGSKNAALPIMAACLLTDGPVRLTGVPRLADVDTLLRVLAGLGMDIVQHADGAIDLQVRDATRCEAETDLVKRMRASFCVLGPLVARRGYAKLSLPGGCRIGDRPVDLHLKGLAALGATINTENDQVVARAQRLRGAVINLTGQFGSTVTGTCNVLCAAVLADGDSWIEGAAREPEVIDLGNFLCTLGARIDGIGTSRIHVRGVPQLSAGTYEVIPDRIEAATWLTAAAITRGGLKLHNIRRSHLTSVIATLRRVGLTIDGAGSDLVVHGDRPLRAVPVIATPYPGVPTDVQAQLTALLAVTPGISRIEDRVFPERFQHAIELNRMGAKIRQAAGVAIVNGVAALTGTDVTATDLRASAALVLGGLAARGTTVVHEIGHLDRGYERLDVKLAAVGAEITRSSDDRPVHQRAA